MKAPYASASAIRERLRPRPQLLGASDHLGTPLPTVQREARRHRSQAGCEREHDRRDRAPPGAAVRAGTPSRNSFSPWSRKLEEPNGAPALVDVDVERGQARRRARASTASSRTGRRASPPGVGADVPHGHLEPGGCVCSARGRARSRGASSPCRSGAGRDGRACWRTSLSFAVCRKTAPSPVDLAHERLDLGVDRFVQRVGEAEGSAAQRHRRRLPQAPPSPPRSNASFGSAA